jgi:GNAT superfamily N-acetyltransferase
MRPGEEDEISRLILSVFSEFVAPLYPPEGTAEFSRYVGPDDLRKRFLSNHFTLVATAAERIVGMIEVRDENHICLFFVDKRSQGRGIGRELLGRALAQCRENNPDTTAVSVNSSPNSAAVYERLGFVPIGPEETKNGITFVPMSLALTTPPRHG